MRLSRFLPVTILGGALGVALLWAKVSGSALLLPSPLPVKSASLRAPRAPYDPNLVHKTLEFYAAQTRQDPGSALFQAMLAGQYLESYRETGDSADALRAEQATRASLKIRTHGNSAALFQLSRALLTQHRFAAALAIARRASVQDPVGLRECADIEIEIGDYAAAWRDLTASQTAVANQTRTIALTRGNAEPQKPDQDPAFLALLSRRNELLGDSNGQLALLTRAVQLADANPDMPAQSVAWFHERLGRCLSMMGRLDDAKTSYLAGLEVFPRDYRTMAALAHLEAARGDWNEAIKWGQKAAAIVPAPETLALLGDAFLAQGKTAKAQEQFRLVEQIGTISSAGGALYDRQRALFYADHKRNLPAAVALARGELRERHDIYAYDTLAWTLYQTGRLDEAGQMMERALKWGTRDASLHFHAGMIAAARRQNAQARTYLEQALQINPHFHPTQPAQAQAMLARLSAAPSAS